MLDILSINSAESKTLYVYTITIKTNPLKMYLQQVCSIYVCLHYFTKLLNCAFKDVEKCIYMTCSFIIRKDMLN